MHWPFSWVLRMPCKLDCRHKRGSFALRFAAALQSALPWHLYSHLRS
jgi:hypothetical protein